MNPQTDQHGHPKMALRFDLHACCDCPARTLCTRSPKVPRILAVRTPAECEIVQRSRQHQQTEALCAKDAQRSGMEGTYSQVVRSPGLRCTRSFGFSETERSHLFTTAAMNLNRLDVFLEGKKTAKTQVSRFAALAPDELAG